MTISSGFLTQKVSLGNSILPLPRYPWLRKLNQGIVAKCSSLDKTLDCVRSWGFDRQISLDKGLNALFSGLPGTQKTMAAEAIAYIRKKTHLQVKRLLLDKEEEGDKQDFSELVQDLLDFWVEIQQGENPDSLIARFLVIQKSEN